MVTLVIIIVFIFVWYFSSVKQLTNKIDVIKEAEINGKETFIDPVTHKVCWTQTGEPVTYTTVLSVGKIPDGCIAGDHVIEGLKTGRIYKNISFEHFMNHVNEQIKAGEVWCFERADYAKNYDMIGKKNLRYHMRDKYFYTLRKKEYMHLISKTKEEIGRRTWDKYKAVKVIEYYKKVNGVEIQIDFEEYKKLGGK